MKALTTRMGRGARKRANARMGLSGRSAGGKLVEDYVEGRVNIGIGSEPWNRGRSNQRSGLGKIHDNRVGKMTNAAVLIFEGSVVPVASGLECETDDRGSQKYGQKPARCPWMDEQPQYPRRYYLDTASEAIVACGIDTQHDTDAQTG